MSLSKSPTRPHVADSASTPLQASSSRQIFTPGPAHGSLRNEGGRRFNVRCRSTYRVALDLEGWFSFPSARRSGRSNPKPAPRVAASLGITEESASARTASLNPHGVRPPDTACRAFNARALGRYAPTLPPRSHPTRRPHLTGQKICMHTPTRSRLKATCDALARDAAARWLRWSG